MLQEVVGYHDALTKRCDSLLENNPALSKEIVSLKEKSKTTQDGLKTTVQANDEEWLVHRSKIRELETSVRDRQRS